MRLKGIDYGGCWDASGVRGFYGEGYWYHRWLRWLPGFSFKRSTFVAKTTTLEAREGNMPLRADGTPRDRFPKCIVVKPLEGVALNSVGLSGPGAKALLETGRWQERTEPFLLSFMSVAPTKRERVIEAIKYAALLGQHADEFRAPVGLQVNLSCPNTGHDPSELAREAREILTAFQGLRENRKIPLVPKINVLYKPEAALELQDLVDGICVSNTLPWGTHSRRIDWKALFGSYESPLKHLGGGGLSGWPLLPLTVEWVEQARAAGLELPINAGGGLLRVEDVRRLFDAGANSIFVGSVAFLRPWRLHCIALRASRLFKET